MKTKTLTLTQNPAQKPSVQIGATLLILLISVLLPFVIHLIPSTGPTPIGAKLLPIFIAPFIAVLFFRFPVALMIAAVSPLVNALLYGKPDPAFTLRLTLELMTFVSIAFYLKDWVGMRWVNAPLSLILSKLIIAAVLFVIPFGFDYGHTLAQFPVMISTAAVGILILGLINILLLSLKFRKQ